MRALKGLLILLLTLEALNSLLWASRIVSAAAAYDGGVLLMVALRILVAALQAICAWMWAGGAAPAPPLSIVVFLGSAVLLVFELGVRLSPSSLQPDLRWPVVAAYGIYALVCIAVVKRIERAAD